MDDQKDSVFSILDLPRNEREVFLYLSRNGPCDVLSIATALGHQIEDIQKILVTLRQKERVRQIDSKYDVVLPPVPPRTLPGYLLSAFLTTDRLYSEQEIAALREAVPILQFARARLSTFTDHGPGHAFRVKALATQMGHILDFTSEEHHFLRAGALLHDIGNVVDRERHNIISQETVLKLAEMDKLPFSPKEAELVGLLCRWHRREYDPERTDSLQDKTIRTGLLASALRITDAMDIDYRRSDHGKKFREVLAFFFPEEQLHWNSADEIFGVRFHCNPDLKVQVFTRGKISNNLQIEMLRKDITGTPLDLSMEEIPISDEKIEDHSLTYDLKQKKGSDHNALIIFPFEPHSIIMAGLSLRHLIAESYTPEILCYADYPVSTKRLWVETLRNLEVGGYTRLIVIGDRPDLSITPQVMQTIYDLGTSGLSISILNRHEANWQRIPELLRSGVEVLLGGDWAYFWGTPVDATAFKWGHVASLCTRDPIQSTTEITNEEYAAAKGLIIQVYEAISQTDKEVTTDWSELAMSVLRRVLENDLAFFVQKAAEFSETYGKSLTPYKIDGKVGLFEQNGGEFPWVNYWMMEATIEKYGRVPVRGMQFNLPYIFSTWVHEDYVDLLAINHWCDDTAIPIRLLYPGDIGPTPQGNECTVRVRIPRANYDRVIGAFVKACNRAFL